MPVRDFIELAVTKYTFEIRATNWIVCNDRDSGLEGPVQDYVGQELSVQELSLDLARELSLGFADDEFAGTDATVEQSLGFGKELAPSVSIPRIDLARPNYGTPQSLTAGTASNPKKRLDLTELVSSKPYSFDSIQSTATGGIGGSSGLGLMGNLASSPSQSSVSPPNSSHGIPSKHNKTTSTQRVQSGKKSPRSVRESSSYAC